MKPDWKDAPEWAQWLAMDGGGRWYWYEMRPTFIVSEGRWMAGRNGRLAAMAGLNPTCEARPITDELLGALEDMARQHCCTEPSDHPSFPNRSDSGAISANADALDILGRHGRFKVTVSYGRMVCGYWPENDPERKA